MLLSRASATYCFVCCDVDHERTTTACTYCSIDHRLYCYDSCMKRQDCVAYFNRRLRLYLNNSSSITYTLDCTYLYSFICIRLFQTAATHSDKITDSSLCYRLQTIWYRMLEIAGSLHWTTFLVVCPDIDATTDRRRPEQCAPGPWARTV